MAEQAVTLHDGLKMGETTYTVALIREESVADMVLAATAAEKIVQTPDGYQLVSNPAIAGLVGLGLQVVRLNNDRDGEVFAGPLDLTLLQKLSAADLAILQGAADGLAQATSQAVLKDMEARGRDSASSDPHR